MTFDCTPCNFFYIQSRFVITRWSGGRFTLPRYKRGANIISEGLFTDLCCIPVDIVKKNLNSNWQHAKYPTNDPDLRA